MRKVAEAVIVPEKVREEQVQEQSHCWGLKVTGEGRLCAPLVLLNPGSCPTRK